MKKLIGTILVNLNFYGHKALWFWNWSVRARYKGWLYYIPFTKPMSWHCARCGKEFPRDRDYSLAVHQLTECLNPLPGQQPRYAVSPDGDSITCFVCGRTSYNPKDVESKYCGYCHEYLEETPHGQGRHIHGRPVAESNGSDGASPQITGR